MAITTVIVVIIVLGIVLVLLNANPANPLVNLVLDVGRWLTTPFRNLFRMDTVKQGVLVNWGLAAVVYLIIGGIVARLARG
jgi:hypothetical protein